MEDNTSTPSQGPMPPSQGPPDAPDKEKMEQIRRRRMEKLAGTQQSQSSSATQPAPVAQTGSVSRSEAPLPASPAPSAAPKPKINIRSAPAAESTPAAVENPFAKYTNRTAETTPPITPRPKAAPTPESDEAYENRILGEIFRITLDPEEKVNSAGNKLIYLPNLRQEVTDENEPIHLTTGRLDSAIMEAASTINHKKSILDYLLPCWKRVIKALKALKGYAGARDVVLKEAKRLCMSHCVFAVELPEMYEREKNPLTDSLVPYLLMDDDNEKRICVDFLTEVALRIPEDETTAQMITNAVKGLSYQLAQLSMKDIYHPYLNVLKALIQFPMIVQAIAEDPLFVGKGFAAPLIEKMTILGPFFRISPMQPEAAKDYFFEPRNMDERLIATSQEALRLTLRNHQKDLLEITNVFIKASGSRNFALDWFANAVNSNHKRRAMQVKAEEVSSDGFMLNVTVVLDGLCEPFMNSTFEKVARIQIDHLRRENPRIDVADETKINADQAASDEFYSTKAEGVSNFISEVFFLALAAHHYGSEALNSKLKPLDRNIKHYNETIVEMEAERSKFVNHPRELAAVERQIKIYVDVLNKTLSQKYAIKGVLRDKIMQARSLMFMRYVTVWLLRVASQTDYLPSKAMQLPLSAIQPEAFKALPEYVLEDIVSNFSFIFQQVPDIMISAVGDEIIALSITFLTNSDYIKNPYLKAKLVTLLFHGSLRVYHLEKGILGDSLTRSKFANDHLLHALMKFYIEAESTGAHTQFYDKFNIRYEIFEVIKSIWDNDVYTTQLRRESRVNTDFFLQFVNLLLNDATYVLDEALTKFPKIHDLQQELRQDPQVLTAEEKKAKEEELATAESQATSYMQLTNNTIEMMKMFTENLSSSFIMPQIVDRVAAMLNYTLDTLVGPKSSNLRVDNTEKYLFDAKNLLRTFVTIYLNLSVEESFFAAVARDGRSYKPKNFVTAASIMERKQIIPAQEAQRFRRLLQRFEDAKKLEDQDEQDFGDIPEEFEDPLLASLMTDPVMLPISRNIIDRATIQSHLLSDPTDPFNRTPLKLEDVVPQPDLKARIQAWRLEMREKARAARIANTMDTTEG